MHWYRLHEQIHHEFIKLIKDQCWVVSYIAGLPPKPCECLNTKTPQECFQNQNKSDYIWVVGFYIVKLAPYFEREY